MRLFWGALMFEFTTSDIVRDLVFAARWTVALSVLAFLFGGLAGLAILFARTSTKAVPRTLAWLYIEAFQGTPLLMQLFLAFFGLSLAGFETSAWFASALSLTLWVSAFLGEIWRGCLEALPAGQWRAGASLGLNYPQQMRYIILPQAFKIAIAPTVGFSVQIVKATALASIVGFVELTKTGTMLANATFEPFKIYGFVALIYFALCWPLSIAARKLEKRLKASAARS